MAMSATDPIGSAFEWTRRVLFEPFDFGKWIGLGFCAWLAYLGEGGGGGSFQFPGGGGRGGRGGGVPSVQSAMDWLSDNLALVLTLGLIIGLVAAAIWLLVVWLSSRAKYMFLDGVVHDRGLVVDPWHRFREHGWALFVFRVLLGLAGLVVFGALIGAAVVAAYPLMEGGGSLSGVAIAFLVLDGALLLLAALVFGLVAFALDEFVVPIHYLHGGTIGEAWRRFRDVLGANLGAFAVYTVLRILLSMGAAIVAVIATCLTCCIAAIPFVGTVILLPLPVFFRTLPLHFLGQAGPEYARFASLGPDTGAAT